MILRYRILKSGTYVWECPREEEVKPVARVVTNDPDSTGIYYSRGYWSFGGGAYRLHRRITHKQLIAVRNSCRINQRGRKTHDRLSGRFMGCLPIFGKETLSAH